jgi:hypothetical protein
MKLRFGWGHGFCRLGSWCLNEDVVGRNHHVFHRCKALDSSRAQAQSQVRVTPSSSSKTFSCFSLLPGSPDTPLPWVVDPGPPLHGAGTAPCPPGGTGIAMNSTAAEASTVTRMPHLTDTETETGIGTGTTTDGTAETMIEIGSPTGTGTAGTGTEARSSTETGQSSRTEAAAGMRTNVMDSRMTGGSSSQRSRQTGAGPHCLAHHHSSSTTGLGSGDAQVLQSSSVDHHFAFS